MQFNALDREADWTHFALITMLQTGDIIQSMGSKEITVEMGHNFTLVGNR
jgi:hypothetical protein